MNDEEVKFVGELSRLEVRPGDRFVITYPGLLSSNGARAIEAMWQRFIGPNGPPVLVLDNGMKISVIGETSELAVAT